MNPSPENDKPAKPGRNRAAGKDETILEKASQK